MTKKTKCITIREMIKRVYGGKRELAATQCGISGDNLNMCIHRGYDVAELKNGDWVMLTDKTKIFKGANNESNHEYDKNKKRQLYGRI
jgi:hypothetical protein